MGNNKVLLSIGVLAGLSEESLDKLAFCGEFYRCDEGQLLISRGAYNDSFIFLLDGELEVYTEDLEVGEFLATIKPGESLGEINLFSPAAASASVYAVRESLVWKTCYKDFEKFVESSPVDGNSILVRIIQQLGGRMRNINEKIASHSSMQATFYSTC